MYNMVNIYKITDINGLCYVGSTRQNIRHRLSNHTYRKKKGDNCCSSHKLDLDNCEIEVLETCNPEIRYEREKYYINTIDCVNTYNYTFDEKECRKQYAKDNKEKLKNYHKKWYNENKYKIKEYQENNKEKLKQYREKNKEYQKEYQKELKAYKNSWGGNIRYNNNLLKIDVNLFQ
jgi:hypothetical protein